MLTIIGVLVVSVVEAPPPIPGGGSPPSDPTTASGFSLTGVAELFGLYVLYLFLTHKRK